MRNNKFKYLLILLLASTLSSCKLQELIDPMNTHYLRFYLKENIINVTEGFYNPNYPKPEYRSPSVFRVMLCDPNTGEMRFDRYLTHTGEDSKGKYIDGYIACDAGEYQLLAYNWDTEITMIMHPNNCYQAYAYTSEVKTKSPDKVFNAPDFLFVSKDIVNTANTLVVDTLYSTSGQYFDANNIVESYFIQIPIKGMENVREITSVVTGMSGGKLIDTEDFNPEPVGIFTSMSKGDIGMDVTNIYATINTFGHIPGAESGVHLIFYMNMLDNKTYMLDIDITDYFEGDAAKNNKWIIIEETIDAPDIVIPDSGGGFKPSVGEWEDVSSDIPII